MGVEAFGLSMHFCEFGGAEHIRALLEEHPEVLFSKEQKHSQFAIATGEYNDLVHIIEFQLLREIIMARCTLATRFSLCNYGTIDALFVKIVTEILSSFDADVWLMTSAIRQKSNYLAGDARWLLAAVPDEIAEMRAYWQNLFGTKQGPVRVKDSFLFSGAIRASRNRR